MGQTLRKVYMTPKISIQAYLIFGRLFSCITQEMLSEECRGCKRFWPPRRWEKLVRRKGEQVHFFLKTDTRLQP